MILEYTFVSAASDGANYNWMDLSMDYIHATHPDTHTQNMTYLDDRYIQLLESLDLYCIVQ